MRGNVRSTGRRNRTLAVEAEHPEQIEGTRAVGRDRMLGATRCTWRL